MKPEAEPQRGIDFAWFLSIWVLECHCDERVFWRTMNPARLMALYGARFKANRHTVQQPAQNKQSLSDYLRGG